MTSPKPHARRFRPAYDTLEGRQLLAVIFDIDTGDAVSPSVHSSLMRQVFDITQAATGRRDTLIQYDASNGSGQVDTREANLGMHAAIEYRRAHPRKSVVVAHPYSGDNGPETTSSDFLILELGFASLARKGIPSSVAAGNRGLNLDRLAQYPAAYSRWVPGVLTVGAATPEGVLKSYSNFGPGTVQVAAKVQLGWGTSGASIVGAIAMAAQMDRIKRGLSSPLAYVQKIVRATARAIAPSPALVGLIGNPGTLTVGR